MPICPLISQKLTIAGDVPAVWIYAQQTRLYRPISLMLGDAFLILPLSIRGKFLMNFAMPLAIAFLDVTIVWLFVLGTNLPLPHLKINFLGQKLCQL